MQRLMKHYAALAEGAAAVAAEVTTRELQTIARFFTNSIAMLEATTQTLRANATSFQSTSAYGATVLWKTFFLCLNKRTIIFPKFCTLPLLIHAQKFFFLSCYSQKPCEQLRFFSLTTIFVCRNCLNDFFTKKHTT